MEPGDNGRSGVPVLVAATVVGLAGAVVAGHQRSSTSVYLGVAILPLVPGFPLYRSMLALAQGESARSVGYMGEVFLVSMSIAIGVAVGIALERTWWRANVPPSDASRVSATQGSRTITPGSRGRCRRGL